jgi:8-oxo-dGTP pyrophosphatase MutT (NUDIX family)
VLDLDRDREPVVPRDAATVVLVRDASAGVEVFCVERNKKSRFMGGAVVFPGGKLDADDASDSWLDLTTPPRAAREGFTADGAHLRALAVAACRETLEEAGILLVGGAPLADAEAFALRARMKEEPAALLGWLRERKARLDLAALHPLARWITPEAEARRYDTRFFLAVAPPGQGGAHDEHETMASFWATPGETLARFDRGEVQLMPPTHRTLYLLATCSTTDEAVALAAAAHLLPIQPRLVQQREEAGETLALVLPGDPEHHVPEPRIAGGSRYVLRGERWLAEDAPR